MHHKLSDCMHKQLYAQCSHDVLLDIKTAYSFVLASFLGGRLSVVLQRQGGHVTISIDGKLVLCLLRIENVCFMCRQYRWSYHSFVLKEVPLVLFYP